MLPEYMERLFSFASGDRLHGEILLARAEFFSDVKDVYAEEHFYEERMSAFLEWYCLDRIVGGTGRTPLELFLESGGDLGEEEAAFFSAMRSTRHSLFSLQRLGGGKALLEDAFSGDAVTVEVDRPLVTLKRGDLIDTRIVPMGAALHFSRTFLVHPRAVRKAILHEVRKAKSGLRLDAPGFLRHLSVLWIRQQRYKGVKPADLYTPEELLKPNRPLF